MSLCNCWHYSLLVIVQAKEHYRMLKGKVTQKIGCRIRSHVLRARLCHRFYATEHSGLDFFQIWVRTFRKPKIYLLQSTGPDPFQMSKVRFSVSWEGKSQPCLKAWTYLNTNKKNVLQLKSQCAIFAYITRVELKCVFLKILSILPPEVSPSSFYSMYKSGVRYRKG